MTWILLKIYDTFMDIIRFGHCCGNYKIDDIVRHTHDRMVAHYPANVENICLIPRETTQQAAEHCMLFCWILSEL